METIRWGIIGCGEVAEVKSGPALQKADGSALVAVMRRDRARAEDLTPRCATSPQASRRARRRRWGRRDHVATVRHSERLLRRRRRAVPG
jgi:predicted dehydrogenase